MSDKKIDTKSAGSTAGLTGKNKLEAAKTIGQLVEAVGELGDSVSWGPWRAKFVRLCLLFGVDAKEACDYGYVNAVLERVAARGSSVSAVLETFMLRDSDSFSLLEILDEHFKLVDNPLTKIRKLRELSFESSGMNLLDFARHFRFVPGLWYRKGERYVLVGVGRFRRRHYGQDATGYSDDPHEGDHDEDFGFNYDEVRSTEREEERGSDRRAGEE